MTETEPSSRLTWESPPQRRYDWDAIAAQLRRRPLEWAKVFDRDVTSIATAIRIRGIVALQPEKGFEVRTTNNVRLRDENNKERRLCTLYLRYNPEKVKN